MNQANPVADLTLARAKAVAAAVPDPELPFLTVADLGILRDVTIDETGTVIATASPTYSGCPAVRVIEESIEAALRDAGFEARVERAMSPPWTSDWITPEGREKLRANGIAPPDRNSGATVVMFAKTTVTCPACDSANTEKVSEFGSTPCKAQYRCNSCLEPFDHFKCI
jgi:ring-1,2-phenylacetyl-CoA epoxidase subunit PaaD